MNHEHWMHEALLEAQKAFDQNEVPIGAVVVKENRIIGRGYNQTESLNDPTAHAEIIAVSAAANYLHSWRLTNATVYVTLEPCLMCTGALILARIKRLVFGAYDKKFGACGSLYNIPQDNLFNHNFEVIPHILAEQSQTLLKAFFKKQRLLKKSTAKVNLNLRGCNIDDK